MVRRRRRIIRATGISSGIVMGKARVILPGEKKVAEIPVATSRITAEVDKLEQAVAKAVVELTLLRDSAVKKIGDPVAKIFDAQLLIASDFQFLTQVKEQIAEQRRNAGFIYNRFVQQSTITLRRSPDPYLRQMWQDIEAVSNRVLAHLGGYREARNVQFPADTILVGKRFTPAQVLSYRNLKAIGLLVAEGGSNSHMALIARSLMLPVVQADEIWTQVENNTRIILDGTNGVVILNPTSSDLSTYQKRKKQQGPALVTRIRKLTQYPPKTIDGKTIDIAANLEIPGPVEDVLASRKIPIGLYRTEFMYLEGDQFPSEELQFDYYRRIAEKFPNTPVVLRTFDLGSDKFHAGASAPHEDNPALGWRGIRSMLEMSSVFKTQIHAILRASTHEMFRILLPMVSDVSEVEKARKLIAQVMLEMRRAKTPFDEEIPIGVMVEVPSAALSAEILAPKVDFMSIGTNDLTQYTMSADRNNARVADLYSPLHPAVLRLIKMTVDACKEHHKRVTVCGEIAGDVLALPLLIGLEIDQLSMHPTKIFDICRMVRKIDSSLVRHLVGSVMASSSQTSVIRKLQSYKTALEKM